MQINLQIPKNYIIFALEIKNFYVLENHKYYRIPSSHRHSGTRRFSRA